eukprot:GEMP01014261.1.p1 GENE.GEMP01014261.1~~GEMP01014261.1.p1  ORF type:complete len:613 (+),score=140.16 GEMP01014261.1:64-1902(+)
MVLALLIAADIAIVSQLAFVLSRANSRLVQKIRGIMCLPPLEPVTPPDSARLRALSYSTWNTSEADARHTMVTHVTTDTGFKVQFAKKEQVDGEHAHHHHHHHRDEVNDGSPEPSRDTIELAGGIKKRSAILAVRLERRAKAAQQHERDVAEGKVDDEIDRQESDALEIDGTPLYTLKGPHKSLHHHQSHHTSHHPRGYHTSNPQNSRHSAPHHMRDTEAPLHNESHHHHHRRHHHSSSHNVSSYAQSSFLLTRDAFSVDSDAADKLLRNILLVKQGSALGEPLVSAATISLTHGGAEIGVARKAPASEAAGDNEVEQAAAAPCGEKAEENLKVVVAEEVLKMVVPKEEDEEVFLSGEKEVEIESGKSGSDVDAVKGNRISEQKVPEIVIGRIPTVEEQDGVEIRATLQGLEADVGTTMVPTMVRQSEESIVSQRASQAEAQLPLPNIFFRVHSDGSMPVLPAEEDINALEAAYDFPKNLNVDRAMLHGSPEKLGYEYEPKKSAASSQTIFPSEMSSRPDFLSTGSDRGFFTELRERAGQSLDEVSTSITARQNRLAVFVENVSSIGILDDSTVKELRAELDAMTQKLDAAKISEDAFHAKATAFFRTRHWT